MYEVQRFWLSAPDCLLCFVLISEDVVDATVEDLGYAECKRQGRHIALMLEHNDRLACALSSIGEGLLGHLVMLESQLAKVVPYLSFRHVFGLSSSRK